MIGKAGAAQTKTSESEVISMDGALVEDFEDESQNTDRWAVPQEIAGEMTPAPVVGPSKRAPDRHLCRTVASPIPAMLAETMGLADEKDVAAPPSQPAPTRR